MVLVQPLPTSRFIPPRRPPPGVFGGGEPDGRDGRSWLGLISKAYYWVLDGFGLTIPATPPQPVPLPNDSDAEGDDGDGDAEDHPADRAAAVSAFRTDWAVSTLGFLFIVTAGYLISLRSKDLRFPQSHLKIEHHRSRPSRDTYIVQFEPSNPAPAVN
ncbi:hypothetical protein Tsubulata_051318 [Turnera subulata]|uniref:Uncharacterized protein n=1 Tax=Turnera subulata TaxID=218843 RepID=A0A9Q0JGK3_9ROSI|nr:hypothetical protein Tsubulata_051318 [Turnera subulata]